MKMLRNGSLIGLLYSLVATLNVALAATVEYELTITAKDRPSHDVPVCVDLSLPKELGDAKTATIQLENGTAIVGQVTQPRLLAEPEGVDAAEARRQLCFVIDSLKAGEVLKGKVTIGNVAKTEAPSFAWTDTEGKYAELSYGNRPVLRYMYESLDESSKGRREETYKVYHHVFDPLSDMIITKGPGGLFPHHRGLFYGFNRIQYGDNKQADTWHCKGKAHQSHDGVIREEAGPVLGRHVVKVGWHGQDGETFANEERELTVYRQPMKDGKPEGTLIEFASILRTAGGEINIDGDPQHAGFQFRASQEVPDKTASQTYYVRVDGVGKPGEYRNWPDRKDQVNFPWKGLSFVLGDNRYTVAYLDHPNNPKEARFSERDYGRFGSYFEYTVTEDRPLRVNYRIWLQRGEMQPEEIAALADDFTNPPSVSLNRL